MTADNGIYHVKRMEGFVKELQAAGRSDVLFTPLEGTEDMFRWLRKQTTQYTVYSAYSDYGIFYQQQDHPNQDIQKHTVFQNWPEIANTKDTYLKAELGPCIKLGSCNPLDKYSVKTDRFTIFTFNECPPQIKTWWCSNLNVRHPKMKFLPFGVNDNGEGWQILPNYKKDFSAKQRKLYVNFQNHTVPRINAKTFFTDKPWVTLRESPNLSIQEFYEEVSSHMFALSLPGMGLDRYFHTECAALGTIFLFPEMQFSHYLREEKYPAVLFNDFREITETALNEFDPTIVDYRPNVSKWDYWKEKLLQDLNQ